MEYFPRMGVVYLLIPTSNHNRFCRCNFGEYVVYLLIPTSNHNLKPRKWLPSLLYIFWFLHQTTTLWQVNGVCRGCISFDSYIKPQPYDTLAGWRIGCISFDSYIKPQLFVVFTLDTLSCISFDSYIKPQPAHLTDFLARRCISFDSYIKPQPIGIETGDGWVVYLLIPTSNHNLWSRRYDCIQLYIFWFLHQTTT